MATPLQFPASLPEASARAKDHHGSTHSWRGKLLTFALMIVALGIGWWLGGKGASHREKEALPPESGATELDSSTVMVTAEPVTYRPVQRTVEAVGTLHGFEEVALSAKVEGRVRKLHHDVADRVKPGELLLEIDPTDLALSVQQAERGLLVELAKLGFQEPPVGKVDLGQVPSVMQARTRMDNARSRQDRARRLGMTRAISTEEQDTVASDLRAAQAEHANQLLLATSGLATIQMKQTALAVAQQQLKDTKLTVPSPSMPVPGSDTLSYAITQRSVAEGTFIRAGTELFKLVICQTLKVRVPVPDRYSAEVKLGQKVVVTTAAFSRPFVGKVSRINPAVDVTTRTFEVEIQVPNPTGELKPGSFAKAAIVTQVGSEAVAVPLAALVQFAGITKVFVAENGRAKEVPVTLGVQTTEWVEITKPMLPRGAQVITSGQTALASDTPVAVREATKKATAIGMAPETGR